MLHLLDKLLAYGIQLNTLVPVPTLYPLPSTAYVLPTRPAHHVFTVVDFEEYQARLTSFCESPRGCVALTAGGLFWRLGYEYGAVHSSVIRGPCSDVCPVRVSANGVVVGDDKLTEEELNIIMGGFHLVSAPSMQCLLVLVLLC